MKLLASMYGRWLGGGGITYCYLVASISAKISDMKNTTVLFVLQYYLF